MSKNLLQINASLFSDAGISTGLADDFTAQWKMVHPTATVTKRDLARTPVPHLTAERFQAFLAKPEDRTSAQRAIVAYSDQLIEELKSADVIVLGVPMYNFGVPSTLKAFFDHVARAGVTFKYTEQGPVGLLAGKKVFVFTTRGGQYAGSPTDTQTGYLRTFLGFLGLTDVEIVYAEGIALGEANKQAALKQARQAITKLASQDTLAAAA